MAGKKRTPLMSGERIQLVVYRGALSILDEFKSVKTVEGEYLHLQPKDGRVVSCSFSDDGIAGRRPKRCRASWKSSGMGSRAARFSYGQVEWFVLQGIVIFAII